MLSDIINFLSICGSYRQNKGFWRGLQIIMLATEVIYLSIHPRSLYIRRLLESIYLFIYIYLSIRLSIFLGFGAGVRIGKRSEPELLISPSLNWSSTKYQRLVPRNLNCNSKHAQKGIAGLVIIYLLQLIITFIRNRSWTVFKRSFGKEPF